MCLVLAISALDMWCSLASNIRSQSFKIDAFHFMVEANSPLLADSIK